MAARALMWSNSVIKALMTIWSNDMIHKLADGAVRNKVILKNHW